MKTEINLENKARFFFAYYGATYYYSNEWGGFNNQVNESNLHLGRDINNKCYLQLKPLSSITDEDAVNISNIWTGIEETGWDVGFCKCQAKHWHKTSSGVADYLRLKGYALPWMGLSVEDVVEAKWIKLLVS